MRKLALFIVLIFWVALSAAAQPLAFVYIQGDKETPIYVKLEGEMQPRYGTNYCILSDLLPGTTHIQILFQQNKFPPQDFTILVPEGGQRSFLVTQKEGVFSLFDLRQSFYIPAGNDVSQDRLPAGSNSSNTPVIAAEVPVAAVPEVPSGPNFIKDMELEPSGTPARAPSRSPVRKPAVTGAQPRETEAPSRAATADGCVSTMNNADFGTFYRQVLAQAGLEARLTFLLDSENCPSPDQARIIARSLEGDDAKLRYLSRVVHRSASPRGFQSLEALLINPEAKERFRQILRK